MPAAGAVRAGPCGLPVVAARVAVLALAVAARPAKPLRAPVRPAACAHERPRGARGSAGGRPGGRARRGHRSPWRARHRRPRGQGEPLLQPATGRSGRATGELAALAHGGVSDGGVSSLLRAAWTLALR